ncbi:MAG: peptide MFS transporter [Bryobacterales bacterium]|nr:peptide MFS transporter [Bryobacterales bacterium]
MAQGATTVIKGSAGGFFGHPRGLATLFMTEVWERFSYYGMRALLILFMTAPAAGGGMGLDVATAGAIYGLYTSAVYMLSLPGGWIADRIAGQRGTVLAGGVLIAAGNLCLAVPSSGFFYTGLVLSATGTGLLKPNVSVMVGQLYQPGDARRDAGFSIFYMGINIGAFVAPLACGYLGQRINWRLGFGLAGLGMVLGVIQYVAGGKHLSEASLHPAGSPSRAEAARQGRRLAAGLVAAGLLAAAPAALHVGGVLRITAQMLSAAMGVVLLATVAAFFLWLFTAAKWTPLERKRLTVVGVLFLASALFWCVFEQAGSTLNLFAQRSTDNRVLGFQFPASWLQSLNALFIITLAPVFAWLWTRLGAREPSSPAKFTLGLLAAGAGFAVLSFGAAKAEGGALVSPMWLVAVYLLHTVGELCLSPVGLSAMTKLAPARIGGLLMGVWFLSLSVGNYLGGRIASAYEALPLATLFLLIAAFGVGAALVLAFLVRPTVRLMGGVK